MSFEIGTDLGSTVKRGALRRRFPALAAIAVVISLAMMLAPAVSVAEDGPRRLLDRLSFELYSSRNFPPLRGQLQTLSGLGFRSVEFQADAVDDIPAMKAMLFEFKLSAPAGHFDLARMRKDLAGSAKIAHAFGMTTIVLAWLPPEDRPKTGTAWTAFGYELERMASAAKRDGLTLAWHNHDYEFPPLADGSRPLDLIFAAAPDLGWEPDIGWITRAGEDPLPWLTRYRDRIRAMHIKDVAAAGAAKDEDGWADVGYGVVDWKRLIPLLQSVSPAPLIIEHDLPNDYARFARRSRDTVAAW